MPPPGGIASIRDTISPGTGRHPRTLSEFNLPQQCVYHHICGPEPRPHKGIDFLVDAARYLPPETPVFFLLLGRLENDRKLRAKIDASPMKDHFILAGFRNNAPAIFAASDAFIMPSTKREGLSRAVIEAMSSGTVPIVTDVGGLPELVADGESGFVVPPMDSRAIAGAILKLAQHPELKKQMGKAAKDRIQNEFNVAATVLRTKEMFEQMMAEKC
ncbi:MAG: glycosyltransferase [Desulfobacterales bacterium]